MIPWQKYQTLKMQSYHEVQRREATKDRNPTALSTIRQTHTITLMKATRKPPLKRPTTSSPFYVILGPAAAASPFPTSAAEFIP